MKAYDVEFDVFEPVKVAFHCSDGTCYAGSSELARHSCFFVKLFDDEKPPYIVHVSVPVAVMKLLLESELSDCYNTPMLTEEAYALAEKLDFSGACYNIAKGSVESDGSGGFPYMHVALKTEDEASIELIGDKIIDVHPKEEFLKKVNGTKVGLYVLTKLLE